MSLNKQTFDSNAELVTEFAEKIKNILTGAIADKGRASLVVSGGRTPLPLFKALSESDVDWSKVDITLADERWVDVDDDASNEKLVRENLLVNHAAAANFIGLKTRHSDASEAEDEVTSRLEAIKGKFDVLILGMGEDGHTASLFPCSEEIENGLTTKQTCLAVQPTTAPNQRMSLSLNALLNSENVFLHLTGESKKTVLEEAEQGDDEKAMPIRAILQNTDVTLMWAP